MNEHQSQVYSEIDDGPGDAVDDGDSIGVEKNPAYEPFGELYTREAHVPFTHIYVNESILNTPIDGEDVEEEAQRVESRVEEEEADVTDHAPMNDNNVEENEMSSQSKAVLNGAEHNTMSITGAALLQAFQGLG